MGKELTFPRGFVWGTASAGHQVEGNNIHSDWWEWEKKGLIYDGTTSGRAVDYWNRYEEDHALMSEYGYPAFRLGVEWARIEPAQGKFDEEAIAHYRKILESLKKRNIKVCLTLYHWVLPQWFAELGGWLNEDARSLFLKFTERAIKEFRVCVDIWVTLNEPLVPPVAGHLGAEFPPQKKSYGGMAKVVEVLLRCHAGAYAQIHEIVDKAPDGGPTMAGIAMAYQWVETYHQTGLAASLYEKPVSRIYKEIAYDAWDRTLETGELKLPFKKPVQIPEAKGSMDYSGVNYYTRVSLKFNPKLVDRLFMEIYAIPPGIETSQMGWQIYPPGFYKTVKQVWERFRKPIFVLENGMAEDGDARRPYYLLRHIAQLQKASADGIDVRGYFQWSFSDNFEWREGFVKKLGLFAVDHRDPNLERKPRGSARMYSEIAGANGITPEIVAKYAPDLAEELFG